MILSIQIDGQTVPLAAPSIVRDPSANLFSADSMMLIIGPNGSGKTTLLGRVAQCALNAAPEDVRASDDVSDLHVVYLTLSPFAKPNVGQTHPRLNVLYRDRVDDPIIPTYRVLNVLADEFALRAGAELRLRGEDRPMMSELHSVIVGAARTGQLTEPAELLQQLLAAEDATSEGTRRGGSEKRVNSATLAPRTLSAKVIHSIEGLTGILKAEPDHTALTHHLTEILGDSTRMHLRALWSALPRGKDRRARLLRGILWKFGLKISKATSDPYFEKKFEKELDLWRLTARTLERLTGDPSLRSDLYRFPLDRLNNFNPDLKLHHHATINLAGTSSGLSALVTQLSLIDKCIGEIEDFSGDQKPSLLLMIDEGDVFLHTAWQQSYVKALNSYLATLKPRFSSVQVLMTTHSAVLMSDFPRDHILRLKDTLPQDIDPLTGSLGEDLFDEVDVSFGAPLETIIRETGGAGTIGRFAEGVIKQLIKDLLAGKKVSAAKIDMIDDPVLRRLLSTITPRSRS